jgi:hypothetical protein
VVTILYRLSVPYLKCMGPEIPDFFFSKEYLHERYLGMGSKTKHKIHLCFIYTVYKCYEGNFVQFLCVLTVASQLPTSKSFRFWSI